MSSIEKSNVPIKGITVKKSEDFSEWFSQVVAKAELADIRYGFAGFIVHMPWAMKLTRKLYQYLEEAIEVDNHEPMLMPVAIPEENLKKEQEHAGFVPEVFWITEAGSEKIERKLALRPTGETQIYPMYSLWVRSYNDLPLKRYQSRITVFRNEMTTRPFLRGREFMFFESHDVFATHDEAIHQIETDMKIMEEVVHNKLFVPFIFFKRPQWDKFKGADDTYASDTLNPDGRRNQISSTHDLGINFAKAFNIKFIDKDGQQKLAYQTCFGPGIWRITAAIIAIHGDDQGLILPFDVAPIQIVIVPIMFAGKEEDNKLVRDMGKDLENILKDHNLRAFFDAREITPGEKYNDWELRGVPIRLELGPREVKQKMATLVTRTDRSKKNVSIDQKSFVEAIMEQAKKTDQQIKERADNYFKDNTKSAKTFDEVINTLKKHRGFVKAPFCSIEMDGSPCADKLKTETSAYVCGIPLKSEHEPVGEVCIVCKKPAKHLVYIAQSI